MGRVQWFEPPRHALILFVVLAVLPAAALAWMSWQLLAQDRALESQRLQERLERAADLVAAALDRRLAEAADRLPALNDAGEDAVVVTCLPRGLEAHPPGRLPYLPVVPIAEAAPARLFEAGEALEFRRQDYAGAAAAFKALARTAERPVRAAALVRLGRVLRKAGRYREALDVYGELARLDSTPVGAVPAELLARQARLSVLEVLGQTNDIWDEARSLVDDLYRGRWMLDHPTFEFYSQEASRLAPRDPGARQSGEQGLALAAAVEALWDEWQAIQRGEADARGRRSDSFHDRSVLLLWTGSREKLVALVAGPAYVESAWRGAGHGLGVTVTLVDAASHAVVERPAGPGHPRVVRTMADTGLPWTLNVASADSAADLAQLAGRRRLLLAGLTAMGLVVLVGGYFTARAVTRELAVARLQSDFVSAVSHEFRTPLTSMRHLTELLDRGVVSDEGRRKQYYAALAHETTRLHRLVESLLNFGRMEAGALEYKLEPVSVAELAETVVAEFAQERTADADRIRLDIEASMPEVRADREALGRALWNLLDNAVKYSPRGAPVRVEAARDGAGVAIRVHDEGPGIEPGEQQRIFGKFARGEAARVSNVKGTGIGLAMVRHIVRAHGGEVRLESQPGKGSTFSIVLPAEGHAP